MTTIRPSSRLHIWSVSVVVITGAYFANDLFAAFDIPDSCRAGKGTYTGALSGEVTYSTCLQDGIEKISLRFAGEFAGEVGFAGTPATIYANRTPSDSGAITIDSSSSRRRARIIAQFGSCGITGSWEIIDPDTDEVLFSGDFDATGTGAGINCDPQANAGGSTGGGSGVCGALGGSMTLTVVSMAMTIFCAPLRRRFRSRL
ncbi:MAG: hypothetical protein KF841_14405 [Phycisphaerae bacterium]|nr:hypothetical protein [Phycisphaerae bacterium]